jgi:hypothetical protein
MTEESDKRKCDTCKHNKEKEEDSLGLCPRMGCIANGYRDYEDARKVDCPDCGGLGIKTELIHIGTMRTVERRYPCLTCSNSGKVTYDEWLKIAGRSEL